MIKIKQAVVVEGKYDKIRLSSVVDAPIFTTDGFRIYKDKEKLALLRLAAQKDGILILTDSDAAGFRIRGFLKSAIPHGKIYHAYIPEILGKERRKDAPSKEGTLGVEGQDQKVLQNALRASGVLDEQTGETRGGITMQDFYTWGLSGKKESRALRLALLKKLGFPQYLSTKALLQAANILFEKDAFFAELNELKQKNV